MRPIADITDAGQLKQIALLLEKENERLHARLQALTSELAKLKGEDAQQAIQLELEKLQAELARLQARLKGNPSERRGPGDGSPGQGPAAAATTPRRGHGPREQPNLIPREEVHALKPEEQSCPACAGALDEWDGQFEESEEVTVVERRFELVTHRRKKYRCRCNGAVVTAPGPLKLVAGGRYSVDFALGVAIDKYLDHMPLERQVRTMDRAGLVIDSQTLWDQLQALGLVLQPSLGALRAQVLSAELVHADETWWRLMSGKPVKNWWAWCLSTPDAVIYEILPTRSTESAAQALGDFHGLLVVDGYAVYKKLARAGPSQFQLCFCWVHARRHFVQIEEFYPEKCKEIIGLIGELYAVESLVPTDLGGAEALELRRELRNTRSRPVIDRIREWAYAQRASPGSELRKAIDYMLRIWPGLTRFLEDPRVPLDNNPAERALRGPILGRKNHYGSRSIAGTKVAALFYSLLETAKLCDVDPARYLRTATQRALAAPGTATTPRDLLG